MKFIIGIVAAAIVLSVPVAASAAPIGSYGKTASANGTHSGGCWTAWAKKTELSSSRHKIGVSWLHASACGPLRNVHGSVSCKDFRPLRHWKCDPASTYTFTVYPVKGHRHERKIVGRAGISKQLTASTARGLPLVTCIVVKRKIGYRHLCNHIPRS